MLQKVEGKTSNRGGFGGCEGVSASPPELTSALESFKQEKLQLWLFLAGAAEAIGLLPLSFSGDQK